MIPSFFHLTAELIFIRGNLLMMSGDTSTLSWKPPPGGPQLESNAVVETGSTSGGSDKILKVCFISNSANLGKNFKLVKCESSWNIRVRTRHSLLHIQIYSPRLTAVDKNVDSAENYSVHLGQRETRSQHQVPRMLCSAPETSEIGRGSLAAPGPDRR